MIPPHIPIKMCAVRDWCAANDIDDMKCAIIRYKSFGREYLDIDFYSQTVYSDKIVGYEEEFGFPIRAKKPLSHKRFIEYNSIPQSIIAEKYGSYTWSFENSLETAYDVATIIGWGMFPMYIGGYSDDDKIIYLPSVIENVCDRLCITNIADDNLDRELEELKRVQIELAKAHSELAGTIMQADVSKVGKALYGSLPPEKWDKNIIESARTIERINAHSKEYEKYLKEFDVFFDGIAFDEYGYRKPKETRDLLMGLRSRLDLCTYENRYDLFLKEACMKKIYYPKQTENTSTL